MQRSTSTITVIPPREVSIRRFYGDGQAEEVERFLQDIKAAWKVHRLQAAEEKRDLLWSYLYEAVKVELRCHPQQVRDSPDELEKVLIATYVEKRSMPQNMGIFQRVTQHNTEPIRAYSHRLHEAFQSLIARQKSLSVSLTDELILKDHFDENLADGVLRSYLNEKLFENPAITFLSLPSDGLVMNAIHQKPEPLEYQLKMSRLIFETK